MFAFAYFLLYGIVLKFLYYDIKPPITKIVSFFHYLGHEGPRERIYK